ncbi:uncharacterized protein [Temnothorax nylanderi]|uniref:uncharacterized protein n=1 Tax=Temnothorax nylanderi TaxID=102681 RepID=UPI003A8B6E40
MRQFKRLERRLNRNPSLKRDYVDFIHEYEALGHLREVQSHDTETIPHCYLPHHCVIKEESDTTKLRVVFNASCKTTTGVSLNDCLMVRPSLQQDLLSIITRFRTFEFVLVADITKMYRQVLVDESQVPLQRILWRDTPDVPIRELELLTVTHGTGSAAFLVIKSMRTLAETEAKNFPIGSKIVLRDFDVDDVITGENTKKAALQVRDETTKLLEKGGFVLRKWGSNSPDLLANLPDSSTMNSTRTLDKEGLLVPVIIQAKMLIQRLWTLQLGWDESLPTELHTQWTNYKSQLSQLNDIRIPRKAVEVKSSNARSKPKDRRFDPISAQELEASQRIIIKKVQRITFHQEIEAIENQRAIRRDSRLLALHPFLDREGLLRVGGRLKNANISYENKHQLILPARHRLTRLIIEQEHKRLLHAGPQATLAAIRDRYWPVDKPSPSRRAVCFGC